MAKASRLVVAVTFQQFFEQIYIAHLTAFEH
jgi:hypothetical protein